MPAEVLKMEGHPRPAVRARQSLEGSFKEDLHLRCLEFEGTHELKRLTLAAAASSTTLLKYN